MTAGKYFWSLSENIFVIQKYFTCDRGLKGKHNHLKHLHRCNSTQLYTSTKKKSKQESVSMPANTQRTMHELYKQDSLTLLPIEQRTK